MKVTSNWSTSLLLLLALAFSACSSDDHTNPVPEPGVIPDTFYESSYYRVMHHDGDGKLVRVQMISILPDNKKEEINQVYSYNEEGRLLESNIENGWRMVYTYTGDVLTRTDEYINSQPGQYHLFEYNEQGKLAQRITYQDIPEEGGEIPTSKDVFVYDENGNLTEERLYYYTSYGAEDVLLTVLAYSDYDDKHNSEGLFAINPFNPLAKFSKNNPGKMLVKNAHGNVAMTYSYTYQYNTKGYPIKKNTQTLLHNGEQGSYQSVYSFR